MLSDKLRSSVLAPTPTSGIQYVGGYTVGYAGTTADVTITFGGSLTGGLASSASEGDLVLVYYGSGASTNIGMSITGYTELADIYANASQYDTNFAVAYKVMGASPDSSFVIPLGTQSSLAAGAVAVQVWRNVASIAQIVTASKTNSVLAQPPAITPIVAGSFIVAGGAGAYAITGVGTYSSSNLTAFISSGGSAQTDLTVGLGYKEWTSGTFTPAQFTFSISNSTDFSCVSATLILVPSNTTAPKFVASAQTQAPLSPTTATVTVNKPAGTVAGDLMVMVGATGSLVRTWTGDTGWVEVADQGAPPNLRIAYKVAGSSEPSSYTFTIDTATGTGIFACILTYRNAVYDTIGTFATNANPLVLPSVNASLDNSVLIACAAGRTTATITMPSEMLLRVADNDAIAPSLRIADQYVLAGATGTKSVSSGATTDVSGVLLTIKPA